MAPRLDDEAAENEAGKIERGIEQLPAAIHGTKKATRSSSSNSNGPLDKVVPVRLASEHWVPPPARRRANLRHQAERQLARAVECSREAAGRCRGVRRKRATAPPRRRPAERVPGLQHRGRPRLIALIRSNRWPRGLLAHATRSGGQRSMKRTGAEATGRSPRSRRTAGASLSSEPAFAAQFLCGRRQRPSGRNQMPRKARYISERRPRTMRSRSAWLWRKSTRPSGDLAGNAAKIIERDRPRPRAGGRYSRLPGAGDYRLPAGKPGAAAFVHRR